MPTLVVDAGGPPPADTAPPAPAPVAPPPPPAAAPIVASSSSGAATIPQPGVVYVESPEGGYVPAPAVTPAPLASPYDFAPPSYQGQPIPQPGVVYVESPTGGIMPAPPTTAAGAGGEPEPGAAAEGDSYPPFVLDDPFASRSLQGANPVLRGGQWITALVDLATYYHLDARAVAADAMGEGLAGGIGDGGLAYGPFQDHLTEFAGRPFYGRGKDNDVVNAWAWTRNGLDYSLRQMVSGNPSARGLKGAAAVAAIVRGYERPADIPGAIALRQGYLKILNAQGNQWVAYIAAKALGPTKGGRQLIAPDTTPATGPLNFPKPTAQWKATLHFLANDVPAAGANARKAGARARAAVRSTLWRAPTG